MWREILYHLNHHPSTQNVIISKSIQENSMLKNLYKGFSLITILALVLMALPLTNAKAVSTSVVISQFQVAGGTAADEFVELHNIGNTSVDLNGYRLVYRSATGTTDTAVVNWTTSTVIPAGGYYLIAAGLNGSPTPVGYDDVVSPNITYSHSGTGSFAAAGGGFALRNGAANTGTIIDSLGYGSATNAFIEGAVTTAPAANTSKIRKVTSCQDTDSNSADFDIANPSTPRNSASAFNLCGGATPTPTDTPAVTNTPTNTPTDPPTNTPTSPSVCSQTYTPIYTVQGSGTATPFSGSTVTVRGVVVGDFQTGLSGFNLQDKAGDSNILTSDGIFVFVPTANALSSVDVAAGDVVFVTGRAIEFNGLTEIDNVTAISICGTDSVAPTTVTLPETTNGELEQYEGMLITIPQTLTVEQNFFQGRYGQVTLGVNRLYQSTNNNATGSAQAIATADLNARSLIVLDDAVSDQNPNPIPYIGQDNTLRAGDTVTGLTGALDFGPINSDTNIRDYRLQPISPVSFTRVNARTTAPQAVAGNVKVASFNVLNYFNGDGQGGGFPTSRGANTLAEFTRQRDKIIAAITAINPDVAGLMEMENDGSGSLSAIQDLVSGLNAATAPNTYALVAEPGPGTDEIKVAMIYKPGQVTPVGAAVNYQTSDPTYGAELFDRPPLAQTFQYNATGAQFTVIVNHFKSKGSCPTNGIDIDNGDGQGCWNAKRIRQAQELLNFISARQVATGDNDVLVIGDLNAYGMEDPIQALTSGGLVNEISRFIGAGAYSYVFDGLAGYLDHALASSSLDTQVTGVTEWHINADEPSVIDYNTEFKPQDLYTAGPYRASDHDPVIVGLNLNAPAVTNTPTNTPIATDTPTPINTPTDTPTATNTPAPSSVVVSQVYGGG